MTGRVTGPGGASWIARFDDPPETLLTVAEHNGVIGLAAGVRWMRDVGSPIGTDPADGRTRALALAVRDRWAGRRDRPYLRAAGLIWDACALSAPICDPGCRPVRPAHAAVDTGRPRPLLARICASAA